MRKLITSIIALLSATMLLTACHSQSSASDSAARSSSVDRNQSTYELKQK